MAQGLGRRKPDPPSGREAVYSLRALRHALGVTLSFVILSLVFIFVVDDLIPGSEEEVAHGSMLNSPRFVFFVCIAAALIFLAAWWLTRQLVLTKSKLDESERELVMRLGQAAEWRDDETGDHTLRVGEYCAAIAVSLGWSKSSAEKLRVAAMLHDIGKIGIPDFVMVKEGELSPEERQLIQAHTLMGSDILADSQVPLIQMAQRIAASHHEKWDGTGYPYSLQKEHIPIEGRIAALADVFDALTSKRRYKDAWSFEHAVNEIKSLSGTHFDPKVVTAFVEALPVIRSIYDKFTSTARMFNISRAA